VRRKCRDKALKSVAREGRDDCTSVVLRLRAKTAALSRASAITSASRTSWTLSPFLHTV
jgi:hypothetical protein